MVRLNLEIWMYLRSPKKDCCTLKRVPHIMHRPRSGATSLTITNRIFGHWDAFCTSLLLLNHLSEPKICKDSTKRFWEEFTLRFLTFFQMSLLKLSSFWFKSLHKWDQAVTRSLRCQSSGKRWISYSLGIVLMLTMSRKWICLALSGCQRTFFISPIDYQSLCTTLTIEIATSRKRCLGEEHMRALIITKICSQKFRAIKEVKRDPSMPV